MNETLKRYLVSSVVTFLAAFLLVVLTFLQNFDVSTFNYAVLSGVLTAGLRAGVKALVEYLIPLLSSLIKK